MRNTRRDCTMKKTFLMALIASIVLVTGCSGTATNNITADTANYNVKQEDYVQKTLVDGITFNVPESWLDSEEEMNTVLGEDMAIISMWTVN